MATIRDERKYSEWQKRMARFRKSGLSISRFCRDEGVAVHSFHYWSKQCATRADASLHEQGDEASNESAESTNELVQFHLDKNVSVSVPADRLDVIQCVLECAKSEGAQNTAFKQVVVQ